MIVALALAVGGSGIAVAGSHVSTADVFAFDNTQQEGSSMLVRTKNGISFSIGTSGFGIHPGHAVTCWVVVFNVPENCAVPNACGEIDVFVTPGPPQTDIFFGAGNIVGGSGTIHMSGRVGTNDAGHFPGYNGDPGLLNPEGAEVHLIPRGHGPMVPANMPAQIHSFGGGCDVDVFPGDPDEVGECADVQFSAHPAP